MVSKTADKSFRNGKAKRGNGDGHALATTLERRIRDSLLPGEAPFDGRDEAEAAHFLLEAAAGQRTLGEPAILLRTAAEPHRMLQAAIVNDDMPFLVDSVAATVAAQGHAIDMLVHPVVPVKRDGDGRLAALPEGNGAETTRESMIYFETPRIDAKERQELHKALDATLADVRAAVADWPKMCELIERDADRLDDPEGAALLRWLGGGMLTLLGHVTRKRDGGHSALLGICRKSAGELLADESYERAFEWFDSPKGDRGHRRAPLVIKANRIANVHRRVPLDLFIVPLEENGKVTALSVHAGVWTSAALTAQPDSVPRLRAHHIDLMKRFGFDPAGHAGKSLTHALTTLPHDLLVGFSTDDIERVATAMMSLVDRPRPRLTLVQAPLGRHLFAFVWLPRDMVSTAVRLQINELLERRADAPVLDWSLEVEGGNLAVLRIVLDIRDGAATPDEDAVDAELQTLLRGWREAVEVALAETEEAHRGPVLAAHYAEAFPLGYRTRYGAQEAAVDIIRLRRVAHEVETYPLARDARLYRMDSDPADRLRLKVYQHGGTLALSDAVPALENFGFRVLSEYSITLGDGALGTVHDFELMRLDGEPVEELLNRGATVEAAIAALANGRGENDVFNRLVVGTALPAEQADWLRAFYRYLRQTGMGFTIYTVVDALENAPHVTRGLIDLFVARHDPAFKGNRANAEAAAEEAIREGLTRVAALNDDRLLRLYWSAIGAVLRTNAFSCPPDVALAMKLDSALVPNLPKPVPWREIFVYSRRVEGIHLRAGPVARGGIRWSDRRDDFRTEVLGLMKAQRVKNAVIVPTGAKGGFYPKQLPDPAKDREAWAAEGKAAYQLFIRSLLSLTDNIVGDKVVHPAGVVIRDGEDPYFVVAADKGTATFSDTANALAEARDFWLGDAFASGGSIGYDHKAMGITARGAWLSVQRHFLEIGVDVQSDSVSVVGCGDMSGDVFGNGMLLSKTLRLVAAFDHRHVFLDPNPDPTASWKERKRLFKLPRSSWADYDAKLISKGGGVFARTLKAIPLSPEVRAVLGTDAKELEPEALIAALLAAPVDLLWFGGIGTYVKSAAENNIQVGDPANDALRIDGRDVRAKVIGEGANLGTTQAGRIEFALSGGRINTDFIDNSAGVDCSDHEVNIKIALAAAKRTGKLTEDGRRKLLAAMTDEVAALVLEDNRLQALALSIAERGGAQAVASEIRLIETLEDRGDLDRKTEGLAQSEELARRAADGKGLTRPELAVLLSSAKLTLQEDIEVSPLANDPALEPLLIAAFPEAMQAKFKREILTHRLRPQLIATVLANRLVNRMGLVHPFELAEEEGATLSDVAAAFVCAELLFNVDPVWRHLETAKINEGARLLLFEHVALAMRSQMADLLRAGVGVRPPSEVIAQLGKGVAQLRKLADELLEAEARRHSARLRAQFAEAGAPERYAAMVSHLFDMDGAVGLAKLAADTGIPTAKLTAAFTDLGARLGLDWAQNTASVMMPSDPWERLLVAGLARDFQQMRLDFLCALSKRKGMEKNPTAAIAEWAKGHAGAIEQFRAMIGRAQGTVPVAPAMLAQIAGQARNLLQR
jgi:glutamate dehydrogenase